MSVARTKPFTVVIPVEFNFSKEIKATLSYFLAVTDAFRNPARTWQIDIASTDPKMPSGSYTGSLNFGETAKAHKFDQLLLTRKYEDMDTSLAMLKDARNVEYAENITMLETFLKTYQDKVCPKPKAYTNSLLSWWHKKSVPAKPEPVATPTMTK